jgi:hypothetical protein
VFDRIMQDGRRKVAVAREGRLLGVLTLTDLLTWVRRRRALEGLART